MMTIHVQGFTEGARGNRELMVELCSANEFIVADTMFRKPSDEIATYRRTEETNIQTEPITADKYGQLDYTPTARRWTNSINMQSQTPKQTWTQTITL